MSVLIFWPSGGASTEVAYEDDESGGQEHEPLTASASTLVDAWGYERYVESDDPAQDHPNASVGIALHTNYTGGMFNAGFAQGPPDPSMPIDDSNPLPYWYLVRPQGSIDCYWDPDTTYLTFHVTNGVSGDELYFEQIVPVLGYDAASWPHVATGASTGDADLSHLLEVQHLSASFAAVDSAVRVTNTGGILPYLNQWADPPELGRYVAIRHGVTCTGNVASTTTATHKYVWRTGDTLAYSTFTGADVSLPASGTQSITVVSSNASGTPVGATERYVPFRGGWVVGLTVYPSDLRTSGQLAFRVRNETQATDIGPTATINATNPQQDEAQDYPGGASYDFDGGDVLRVFAEVTSGTFAPTSLDCLVHVTVAHPW